jgi:hypothetical protein
VRSLTFLISWLMVATAIGSPALKGTGPAESDAGTASALVAPTQVLFPECPTLDVCMAWLDARVPENDDGSYGSLCDPALLELRAYGALAKDRLLEKLSANHAGWRNLASCILQNFPGLTDSDVPALREALRSRNGGWIANALGKIATDSAIQALIEDLPHGAASQTGFALTKLGQRALTALLDYMALHSAPGDPATSEA